MYYIWTLRKMQFKNKAHFFWNSVQGFVIIISLRVVRVGISIFFLSANTLV